MRDTNIRLPVTSLHFSPTIGNIPWQFIIMALRKEDRCENRFFVYRNSALAHN